MRESHEKTYSADDSPWFSLVLPNSYNDYTVDAMWTRTHFCSRVLQGTKRKTQVRETIVSRTKCSPESNAVFQKAKHKRNRNTCNVCWIGSLLRTQCNRLNRVNIMNKKQDHSSTPSPIDVYQNRVLYINYIALAFDPFWDWIAIHLLLTASHCLAESTARQSLLVW